MGGKEEEEEYKKKWGGVWFCWGGVEGKEE